MVKNNKRPKVPRLTKKKMDEALAHGMKDAKEMEERLNAVFRPRYRGGEIVLY